MKIRVRHTYDFGDAREAVGDDLLQPRAWDAAREVPGPFHLPESRAAWEARADDAELRRRARDIVALAEAEGAASVCSHGVGTALLELNIVRVAPELALTCTDYAPQTVERLRQLFPEAEVVARDLTDPDPPSAALHLMHRLDAELDDDDWRRVFAGLPQKVLFVPNHVLSVSGAAREVARRLVRRGRLTRAGWFRNEPALRALWSDTHADRRVLVGGAPGFLLVPR
ncbi:MAG: hypothetical protein QOH95_1495 [Gaiellaceae bacterium]|jgi:hypothetical protein|nr:hypothetical protein [Gaiellaceae bacterium]